MKYCPYCGEPLLVPSAKFCPECGETLHTAPQHSKDQAETVHNAKVVWTSHEDKPDAADAYDPIDAIDARPPIATAVVEAEDYVTIEPDEPSFNDAAFAETFYSDTVYDNSPQAKEPVQKARPEKAARVKRQPSGKGKIFLVIVCSLLLLVCAAGYLVLTMNAKKAPAQAAKAFVTAVSDSDYAYVLENIETAGSGLSSAAGVKKLVAAMQENMDMNALRSHLTAPEGDIAAGYEESYSCFGLKQTKDSLFSQKFVVKLSPVQVAIQTAVDDMTLYVDDKKVQVQKSESGLTLKTPPGTHKLRAVYEAYGPEYELGLSEFTSFSAKEPQEVTVTKNLATAEVELAGTETGVQVLIDNVKTSIEPQGGFIELSPAFVGMQVSIKCDQYTQDFTVSSGGDHSFVVDYIAQVEAQGGIAPAEMSNRQLINSAAPRFYSFYQSYLEAINVWDKKLIKNVSADYLVDVVQKMEAYNKDLLFNFHGMTFDRRSLSRSVKEGEFFVSFNVKVDFNYAYKSDNSKWFAGGNYQGVTMHYLPAAKDWEVYGSTVKDQMQLSDDVFTINP